VVPSTRGTESPHDACSQSDLLTIVRVVRLTRALRSFDAQRRLNATGQEHNARGRAIATSERGGSEKGGPSNVHMHRYSFTPVARYSTLSSSPSASVQRFKSNLITPPLTITNRRGVQLCARVAVRPIVRASLPSVRSAPASSRAFQPRESQSTSSAVVTMPLKFLFGPLEYSLEGSRLRIGRADHLDITISGDPLVSSQHCVIQSGKLCDAQSTNGTMINKAKIPYQTPVQLKAGDVVTVGETNLFVEEGLPYEDAPGQPSQPSASSMHVVGTTHSSRHGSRGFGSAHAHAYEDAHGQPSQPSSSSMHVVGTTHSSRHGSRGFGSAHAHAYEHGDLGEDRGAFTSYTYANHLANTSAAANGDDLSATIHSTREWSEALAAAKNGEDSDESSDEGEEGSPAVEGGDRPPGSGQSADDTVTYTYTSSSTSGSGSGSGSLRPPSSAHAPSSSSSSSVVGHRPSSSPSTLRPPHSSPKHSEEEVWHLKQALTKSELKCMNLEKKLNHAQRKSNLLQQKQRINKFEAQIQNLEYQMVRNTG
jgi:hypothetical protein